MPYSQQERLIALTTPLGEDVLLLAGFSGHEAISRLFSFHLDLLSEKGPIDFAQIIGKKVTITVTQSDKTPRYFNGIVSHFAQSGSDARFTRYQMQMVPWTWLLTRYADCKIFHNKTVQEILEQVFKDRGLTDYTDQAQWQLLTDGVLRSVSGDRLQLYFPAHGAERHLLLLSA